MDLSGSILEPIPGDDETVIKYDTISYINSAYSGVSGIFTAARGAWASIQKGDQIQTNYSGDVIIARGYDEDCTAGIVGKNGQVYGQLCIPGAGFNENEYGLVCIENEITITSDCFGWYGAEFMWDLGYVNQAGVWLFPDPDYDGDPDWGFAFYSAPSGRFLGSLGSIDLYMGYGENYFVDNDANFDGSVDLLAGVVENHGGYNLAEGVRILWFGDAPNYGQSTAKTLTIHAQVCQYYQDPESDVRLDIFVVSNNRATWFDDAPFDGEFQFRYCPPSMFIVELEWFFGGFRECFGGPVTIFFPYIPKLQATNFWSGIAMVNQGFVDFAGDGSLWGDIYEATGTHWEVTFPALPERNMHTWLLSETDGGVAFVGASDDPAEGLVLTPTTSSNDLIFGDYRMSMFVNGTWPAKYLEELYLGDLDGYMLIGNGADINGSYLPRNYDNDIPGQNADLPLHRSKTSNGQNPRFAEIQALESFKIVK
jgi:hypothetical protein